MRLFEHGDFFDLIQATQTHFQDLGKNFTEDLIEKDYYVTEALRIIAAQYPHQIIFKGGTSLSKAWDLIQRFSEDIDLFLNKQAFDPALGEAKTDKTLKAIVAAVETHPAFTLDAPKTLSKKGVYRHAYFQYPQNQDYLGAIANRIFLEIGTRSGTYPVETRDLSSYIAQFLQATDDSLGAEDENAFPMPVLHFRRTFVEKLFAIHGAIAKFETTGQPIGNQIRHYYDLYCLLQTPDVQQMLATPEYSEIKENVFQISQSAFPENLQNLPPDLRFSHSPAFNPKADTEQVIQKIYEDQMGKLCYGTYPAWQDLKTALFNVKDNF